MSKSIQSIPLSRVIDGFMINCRARQLSEHTISDYAYTLKIFVEHVGDVKFASIESSQVAAFMAAQTSVGPKTALNYHTGLSALWTWAIKQEFAQKHVVRLVDKPKPTKIVIIPFTELEMRALLTGIRLNAERDRAVLLLLLDTGLRASELCGLKFKDIDMVNFRLKVLGKGDKERLLPFSSRTATALFKHLASLPDGARPFTFSRTSLGHHIKRIGQRAGVPDAHPHQFRHTFAINYLRNGGDPYTLQDILGHSTMEMVRLYLKIAQVDIDAAHKRASPVDHWKL